MGPSPVPLLLVTAVLCWQQVQAARILAVIPSSARSHHRFSQPVLKALASAGHDVVVYSPFPLETRHPNYTDVFLENVKIDSANFTNWVQELINLPYHKCIDMFPDVMDMVYKDFFTSEAIKQLLNSKEHFDLVITEVFCGQEFSLILGQIFSAPVIGLQPFTTNSIANVNLGNDLAIPYIPDTCSPFGNKMSYIGRLLNTVYILRGLSYVYYQTYLPYTEAKLKEQYPNAPPLLDMINNMSLIFINDHLTADYARPRTSNIIPVAGIHIEGEKPLPKDILRFMDEAPDGVIFVSMGSIFPDELQSREYFDMYCNVFRQLRQRVLWKTRKENIQGLPDNVMTVKWAPQRDILAHPKCVLFVTHGGLLSQHEAVHFGVPVIAIPFFFDQHRNAKFYEEQGIGVQLSVKGLSEGALLAAIWTVLENPQYSSNMKRLSLVFRDRPLTPAETVVFWTEYVLRYGGSHLRPASTRLSWYQLALLDVLTVILAAILSLAFVMYFILKMTLQNIRIKLISFNKIEKFD